MRTINKPVEAIVTYNAAGIPTPHRIKIHNDDDDEATVLQISRILFMEKQRDAGNNTFWLFRCRTVIGERAQDLELKYELKTCIWYLYRM